MSFFEEFKKFAMRGNVIDLAVGVVIGGAFGKITSSLVDNIIMPPLSLLFGKVDFSGLFISLNGQHYDTLKAAQDAHAPILAYGLFINTIVNFLIIAFAIFVLIKQINRLTPPPAPAPEPRLCPFCKTAIADDEDHESELVEQGWCEYQDLEEAQPNLVDFLSCLRGSEHFC